MPTARGQMQTRYVLPYRNLAEAMEESANSTYKKITTSNGTITHAFATHLFRHLYFLVLLLSSFGNFTLSKPPSLAVPCRLLIDISNRLQNAGRGLSSSSSESTVDTSPSSRSRKNAFGDLSTDATSESEVL